MLKFRLVIIPFFAVLAAQAQNVRFNIAVGCTPPFGPQPCTPSNTVSCSLGGIDVTLTPSLTPVTVANFMSYVTSGAYDCTIIHRSLNAANSGSTPPYLIQGGGYVLNGLLPMLAPQNSPITNEFSASNVAGSLAMSQYAGELDSATNQWYFNVTDNSSYFDAGEYTVFGNVANDVSMSLVNQINQLPTWIEDFNGDSNFSDLPLWTNYSCPNTPCPLIRPDNYIFVTSIATISAPAVTAAGVADAATFQDNNKIGISPGEIITLFGTNFNTSNPSYLGPTELTTLTLNSAGSVNTTLEGTEVTFNGVASPVWYTSDQELAVVVPYEIANQTTVNVVVSYLGVPQTNSMQFNVAPTTPGLFVIDGSGDAAIVRVSDSSIISTSNPASAGDALELYGEGYGVATTNTALPDGAVTGSPGPTPAAPVTLLIDGKSVPQQNCTAQSGCLSYAGGAGGVVNGVMQINFTVPQLAAGQHQIQIQVGSATSPTGVILDTH